MVADDKNYKNKYFDCLQKQEDDEKSWDDLETLLRKAITRLSISAKGHDTRLDRILSKIQKHSREKNNDALGDDLDELSRVLNDLDDQGGSGSEQGDSASISELIEDISSRVRFNALLETKIDVFKDRIHSLDQDQCIGQFSELVNQAIEQGLHDDSIQKVLITLVEKVAFTHGNSDELDRIKLRLEDDFDEQMWQVYMDEVIEEIRNIISDINNEKIELEGLIVDVTQQLGEISSALSEEMISSAEGRRETQHLQSIMNNSVANIQDSVRDESDIDTIKGSIHDNLEAIKTGIEDFVSKDTQRFQRSEERNKNLQKQIRFMEHESQQLKMKLSENKQKLMFDTLTGARSRLSYDEIIDVEMARWSRYQEEFSYAVIDIDHFKKVNDEFGHNAGDKALKIVARMMGKHIRQTDFLFRIGGEEFVLLLPKTTLENAIPLVEKIRRNVSESSFHFKKIKVTITLSAGLTAVAASDNAERIYERADKALYQAKNSGRNRMEVIREVD